MYRTLVCLKRAQKAFEAYNARGTYSKRIRQTPGTRRASRKFLSMFKKNEPKREWSAQRLTATFTDVHQAYTKRTKRAFNALLTCLRRAPGVC